MNIAVGAHDGDCKFYHRESQQSKHSSPNPDPNYFRCKTVLQSSVIARTLDSFEAPVCKSFVGIVADGKWLVRIVASGIGQIRL